MTKTQNTQTETNAANDFSYFQGEFGRWANDFAKFFGNTKAPSFNFDALFAQGRRNVEALSAANQVAFDSYKTLAKRQAELTRQAFEDFAKVGKEMTVAGSTEDKLAKQADAAKVALAQTIENMQETLSLVQKTQQEAIEVLGKRLIANLDETKSLFAKRVE